VSDRFTIHQGDSLAILRQYADAVRLTQGNPGMALAMEQAANRMYLLDNPDPQDPDGALRRFRNDAQFNQVVHQLAALGFTSFDVG
jgi:hypothetical protein